MAGGENPNFLPNIRVVLLGSVDEGKRSAGNTILDRDEFGAKKTGECVTKKGLVQGRHLTVINTPGWGREQRLNQTPGSVLEQLLQSVFPPGAQALLLVIRADRRFTEAHRAALQDHVEHLGEGVWDHTMLLFTCGDWLGDLGLEQFIYCEGQPLMWVVEKCNYRCYCINNSERADVTQISKLLECIEFMVAMNKRKPFVIDRERHERELEKAKHQGKATQDMRLKIQQMMGMRDDPPSHDRCDSRNVPPKMKAEPVTPPGAEKTTTRLNEEEAQQ